MKRFFLIIFLVSICSKSQTQEELQRLDDFSKIYGVVRYFHPSDEAAKLDWNQFALYGVQEVLKAKSQEEFSKTIKNLFAPVAPSLSFEGNQYSWNKNDDLYPVYWEHIGLGLDQSYSTGMYSSKRINRLFKSEKFLAYGLNLEKVEHNNLGKVRLLYKAKTVNGGGAHGWIKLLDKDNKSVLFKNKQTSPVTSIIWKSDTILLDIDGKNFTQINLGLIANKGTAEFKDVKLEILKENGKWSEIKLPDVSDKKWFTVNDPEYKVSKNHLTLINDFMLSEQKKSQIKEPYTIIQLSNGLTATVPIVVYSDKTHTLPVSSDFKSLQNKVNSIPQNEFSKDVSIANVIITWNVFRHFFPYQEEVKVDWENELRKAIQDAFDDRTGYEGVLTLRRFTEIFKDGHISINNRTIQKENETYAAPIAWKLVEGKPVVSKVMGKNLEINVGDIVDKVNGQTSKQYLDSVSQYISGSKQWKEFRSLQEGLKGKENEKFNLTLENGKTVQLLKDKNYTKNADFYRREDTIKIKELNDILYINLDKLDSVTVANNISKIKSHKKIIFDLRGYPISKGMRVLFTNFFHNKFTQKNFHIPIIYYPDLQNVKWIDNGWDYMKRDSLEAKVVLLVDERAISFAESTTAYLKENGYVTVMGRPTAGANGDINRIKLLGESTLVFTGMKTTNYDGSQFHALGIVPDLYVEEKVEDIVEGRDVFVEKAIEFLN